MLYGEMCVWGVDMGEKAGGMGEGKVNEEGMGWGA